MTADQGAPPTVTSLHILAEHVLAAGLYAATGRIGLRVVPGGFATPAFADEALGGSLIVAHGTLVREGTDGSRREAPVTTVAAAAELFGVAPGMPSTVYTPATVFDLDVVLEVDPAVAERVGAWYDLADAALVRFAEAHAADDPSARTLWPEHFDVALSMEEVNYGASPGDELHAEPYLYVGPWSALEGPFWNEPFGASASAAAIASVDDAVAFFELGHELAAAPDAAH